MKGTSNIIKGGHLFIQDMRYSDTRPLEYAGHMILQYEVNMTCDTVGNTTQ